MKEKLHQLGQFLLEVLLYGIRVFINIVYAVLNETENLVSKLDVLVNAEITKVETPVKPVVTPTVSVTPTVDPSAPVSVTVTPTQQ